MCVCICVSFDWFSFTLSRVIKSLSGILFSNVMKAFWFYTVRVERGISLVENTQCVINVCYGSFRHTNSDLMRNWTEREKSA